METDPSIVDITTSLGLLILHGISVPPQISIYPIIDMILVNDVKVSQSIIDEIEYLEIIVTAHHQIVLNDGDETLRILTHSIQDVLLHYLIKLITLINHQIQ